MKAMILAAGKGSRLKPLTDTMPKALIQVKGQPLIVWQIQQLVQSGITEIVINLHHFADQIQQLLGNGAHLGARIDYSLESEPLETGGGIFQALNKLGDDHFLVLNGDIFTDFDFASLQNVANALAHIVLVDKPPHYASGDFSLRQGKVVRTANDPYTFAGIAVYHPTLFADKTAGRFSMAPLLQQKVDALAVTGEHYAGLWHDIGDHVGLIAARNAHYHEKSY